MNYKFCPHCGRKVSLTAPFCPHCGYKLNSNMSSPNTYGYYQNDNISHANSYNTYHHRNKFFSIVGAVLVIVMIACYLFYRHTIPSDLKNHTIKGSSNFIPASADGGSKGSHSPEEYFDDESIFGEYDETESDFYNEYDSDNEFSDNDSSDDTDQGNDDTDTDTDNDNSDTDTDNDNSDTDTDNDNSDTDTDNGSSDTDTDNDSGDTDTDGDDDSDDSYKLHHRTPYFLEDLDTKNIHNKLSYHIGSHTVTLHIQLGKLKATAHYKIKHVHRYDNHKVKLSVSGTNKYSKNTSFIFNKFSKDHCVVHASNGSHHSTQRFDGSGVSFSK